MAMLNGISQKTVITKNPTVLAKILAERLGTMLKDR
ncbi:hypothetical protein SPLC1_S082400 [Arthrospira platensis C1]|nr:hypothetical protein SPLC1_S082400 [Arthrospira platensis C1]